MHSRPPLSAGDFFCKNFFRNFTRALFICRAEMRGPSAEEKIKRALSAQKFKLSPQSRLPAALSVCCFCALPKSALLPICEGEFQAGGDNRLGRHIFPYFRGKKSRRRGRKRAVRSGGKCAAISEFCETAAAAGGRIARVKTLFTAAVNFCGDLQIAAQKRPDDRLWGVKKNQF